MSAQLTWMRWNKRYPIILIKKSNNETQSSRVTISQKINLW